MLVVGTLEADFQNGREYEQGGLGPLFRQRRIEAPYTLWELLSRCGGALQRLEITEAIAVFIDEDEVELPEPEGEASGTPLDGIDLLTRRILGHEEGSSFHLLITFEDELFAHDLTIEAATDHPHDEAAITVLDRARPLADVDADEDGALYDAVEDFLAEVQEELDRALHIQEPEIEVWYEEEGMSAAPAAPEWAG